MLSFPSLEFDEERTDCTLVLLQLRAAISGAITVMSVPLIVGSNW